MPGFGQAFLAALYCTQTCVMSVSSLLRGTVSPPTTATAFAGTVVLVLAAVGPLDDEASEPEPPPQALIRSAAEQRARPASGTRRRSRQMHGTAL